RERKLPPQVVENLKKAWHLDDPLWVQYGRYLGGLVRGDLGPSLSHPGVSVNEIIADHFPFSLTLGLVALAFALVFGVSLGMFAAARQNRWPDHLISGFGHLAVSTPSFVIGPLLILVVSLQLGWLPPAAIDGPTSYILPGITLGLVLMAAIIRLTRAGFLDVLSQDYIRTAHAKGLSERSVLLRHALRPGILPVLVFLGPATADVISGAVVVENIFDIPGLGAYFVNSVADRDYTVLTGISVFYVVILMALNLVVDLTQAALDPRAREVVA
ncbi:MAG: ABC transporter permease, partial [Deltaproteobacteria bacterium]|nr:ABC transporter permease [Deltaproteobacteria bacterium]